jgi:hypothetical protein
MSLAVVRSRALDGLNAPPVQVEVQLANGLPSFTLVGLADTEVKESRERVRAALQASGFAFPHNKRVTVNLAPADLPKVSTGSVFANTGFKCETFGIEYDPCRALMRAQSGLCADLPSCTPLVRRITVAAGLGTSTATADPLVDG